MSPPSVAYGGRADAERYEELRRRREGLGHAVLRQQGMWAWLRLGVPESMAERSRESAAPKMDCACTPGSAAAPVLPCSVERAQLVAVWAGLLVGRAYSREAA